MTPTRHAKAHLPSQAGSPPPEKALAPNLATAPNAGPPPVDETSASLEKSGKRSSLLQRVRSFALPFVLCLLAAMAAMYPISLRPDELRIDRFTSTHILILEHVWNTIFGDEKVLGHFLGYNFPDGVEVRIVAWPLLIVALGLRTFLSPIVAMNLAQILALAAGGWAMVGALRALGVREPGPTLAGVSWSIHPFLLTFLANGQFENCSGFGYAFALWGVGIGGFRGATLTGAAVLLTGLSSPYQVVPVGLVIGFALLAFRPKRFLWIALAALLALIPPFLYFSSHIDVPAPAMGPGPSREKIPVASSTLFKPWFHASAYPRTWDGRRAIQTKAQYLDAVRITLEQAYKMLSHPEPQPKYFVNRERTHASYMGVALAVVAALGILLGWRHPAVWTAVLAGIFSWLFAFGQQWIAVPYLPRKIPLPWAYTIGLHSVRDMGMTYRFIAGTAFSLCVCAAFAVSNPLLLRLWRIPAILLAVVFGVAITLDSLLFGPFKVPVHSFVPRLAGGYSALPDRGAIMEMPYRPRMNPTYEAELDPFFPGTMALLHGRKLVYTIGGGPSELIEKLPLTRLAKEGGELTNGELKRSIDHLRYIGVSYLSIRKKGLPWKGGRDLVKTLREQLGPPDAEGDGVIAYRLDKPSGTGRLTEDSSQAGGTDAHSETP